MSNSLSHLKMINAHLPWLLMMALLTLQSSISGDVLSVNLIHGLDKVVHFFIFGVLGWLLTRGFDKTENIFINRNSVWIIPLIIAFFGAFDEYHQTLTPGRFADITDWLSDFSGAVLFMIIYRQKKKSLSSASV
ncbi:MAG: VanZ family protein [Calditrichaeota bacterium]|nr:VanZ family protein [Calditrichota bacterium]